MVMQKIFLVLIMFILPSDSFNWYISRHLRSVEYCHRYLIPDLPKRRDLIEDRWGALWMTLLRICQSTYFYFIIIIIIIWNHA